jgi:hypothetical protein
MDFSSDSPSKELQEFILEMNWSWQKNKCSSDYSYKKSRKRNSFNLKEYPNVKKILHCFSVILN